MADHPISISDDVISQLTACLAEPKFRGDACYPEPDESVRDRAEALLNAFIERLIACGPRVTSKAQILAELKFTLVAFDDFDSEEQDKLMLHLDPLFDLLGIESTDGLIGRWRYGLFDAP